ncbi:MAG: hypothetical protein A3B44_03790 [Candidatus Levybacteria bacterium RIFCSPLOWO2_01_FULL_38_21]|nr:MAG: hypothetical protein A3B44_03790 [Candidatus Levybacteria bacterium RIFCSPLOWO2_01_FULL_38_21]
MTIRLRTAFFIGLGIIILWFFYIERTILTPFILGAIFAYVLNPVINFITHRIKLPRTLSVLIIYALIVTAIVMLGTILTRQVLQESTELRKFTSNIVPTLYEQINQLPFWIKPEAQDLLNSFVKSKFLTSSSIIVLFPRALSGFFGFLVFLFSGFYFLKDGGKIFEKLAVYAPREYKVDIEILFRKINSVFGDYLRGQIFMIFFVSTVLFVALTVLGIRFALILAVFSGFAEIVPIIGPIVAGTVAAVTVLINGQVNFGLTPVGGAITIAIVYTVVRQFQDYFVVPHVMGRIAKLHPVLILFAALAGEHIAGILGLVLAVPAAAAIRLMLEFFLNKINERSYSANK